MQSVWNSRTVAGVLPIVRRERRVHTHCPPVSGRVLRSGSAGWICFAGTILAGAVPRIGPWAAALTAYRWPPPPSGTWRQPTAEAGSEGLAGGGSNSVTTTTQAFCQCPECVFLQQFGEVIGVGEGSGERISTVARTHTATSALCRMERGTGSPFIATPSTSARRRNPPRTADHGSAGWTQRSAGAGPDRPGTGRRRPAPCR